ncbi:6-carboxytetrahydropterin synthase QueD [Flexithrix dorotheae]|uniref:6-carboxytetrahydropterin synthase QueD n=1 Tax=Flexithrix dorotheae TaxID=70993 RepID=UPI00036B6047|nr:6-carboxytetrahydropterin synthase QueD [Flexithrix dorotheae]
MVHVCRIEHFNAAHKLYNPNWSKEKNVEVFGPCANDNWHGHNFELIVTVKGKVNPETGFVIDMKLLGKIIKQHIIKKVDHKNLNLDVDFLEGKMASCENLAVEFWKILDRELKQVDALAKLHCIELYETPKNFVRYYGE